MGSTFVPFADHGPGEGRSSSTGRFACRKLSWSNGGGAGSIPWVTVVPPEYLGFFICINMGNNYDTKPLIIYLII